MIGDAQVQAVASARARRSDDPAANTAARSRSGVTAPPTSGAARRDGSVDLGVDPQIAPFERADVGAAASTMSEGVTQSCSSSIALASMRAMSRMSRQARQPLDRPAPCAPEPPLVRVEVGSCRLLTATVSTVSGVRRSWLTEASSVDARSARCRSSSAALRSNSSCARSTAIAAKPGDRVERAGLERARGRRAGRSARVPNRSGTRRVAGPPRPSLPHDRRRCARARRIRASPASASADVEVSLVHRDVAFTALMTVPASVPGRQIATRAARTAARCAAPARPACWSLRRQQHVAAQVVEPRELVPPLNRLARPRLRRRRKVARNDGDDEKREQRHPVLRIGDREVADGRQEEEVERHHGAK